MEEVLGETKACQFIDGCTMFEYFTRAAKAVYLNMYCNGYYADCERRKLRLEGKPVPKNLLPNGNTLWDDDQEEE